jgi:hypothetical protein
MAAFGCALTVECSRKEWKGTALTVIQVRRKLLAKNALTQNELNGHYDAPDFSEAFRSASGVPALPVSFSVFCPFQ